MAVLLYRNSKDDQIVDLYLAGILYMAEGLNTGQGSATVC